MLPYAVLLIKYVISIAVNLALSKTSSKCPFFFQLAYISKITFKFSYHTILPAEKYYHKKSGRKQCVHQGPDLRQENIYMSYKHVNPSQDLSQTL